MLPQMKKKGVAMIIASLKKEGSSSNPEEESSPSNLASGLSEKGAEMANLKREKMVLIAEGVLEAVRTKDAEALADALQWFYECCGED